MTSPTDFHPESDLLRMAIKPPWTSSVSPHCECRYDSENHVLHIAGPANCHALVEFPFQVPRIYALEAEALCGRNTGNAWGPGIALCWPGGRVLRVNVRADGRYGVDDGRRTTISGSTPEQGWTALRLRLTPGEVLAEAAAQPGLWAVLAAFPRDLYPGDPCAARLGKMSRWCTAKDHHNLGAQGDSAIRNPALSYGAARLSPRAP